MIRLVTVQNFASIDTRLEAAYRRRIDVGQGSCLCLDAQDEDDLLLVLLDAKRRRQQGRDWLRKLRSELDSLTSTPSRSCARRRSARIRANVEKPASSPKRSSPTKL